MGAVNNDIGIGGFISVLKPPGMSSHDVIGHARRVLHIKKIGHAGTLDPAAAGVLPLAVGQSTRLIEYLELADKSYRAEVTLGLATDSGDDTGTVIERRDDFTVPTREEIEQVLAEFTGEITQVPPAHSAIKINGRRACDLLREGKAVEIPSRRVTINSLRLLGVDGRKLLIDVDCSKGTYIRTLCIDIGARMGIPALMSFLVRTRVGAMPIATAITLEALAERGASAIMAPDALLTNLARYDLAPEREKAFRSGLSTGEHSIRPATELLRVYAAGTFLGIGRYDSASEEIVPQKVLGN